MSKLAPVTLFVEAPLDALTYANNCNEQSDPSLLRYLHTLSHTSDKPFISVKHESVGVITSYNDSLY